MKALFFPQYVCTPHFETELELMADHLDKGDEVYVVYCKGEMPTCLNNIEHDVELCFKCKFYQSRGLKVLGIPKKNIINLPKKQPSYKPITKRFQHSKELKEFKIDGVDIGAAAASTLFFTHDKEYKLDTISFAYDVYRELKMGWYIYTFFLDLAKSMKPDVVYIFNGRFTGARMMWRVCEKLHIDFFTHERGGLQKQYLLRKNAIPHDLDVTRQEILDLWNNAKNDREEVARRFFIDRRKGMAQGFHSFTKDQAIGSLPKNFDSMKINIAIFNSTLEENASVLGWENPIYEDDLEATRKLLEYFKDNDAYHLYLRVHPNLKGSKNSQIKEIEKYKKEFSNLTVIPPESRIHSYTLLDNCPKIVVFGSTIGVEACYWGKPAILLARATYESLDCCYKPTTHEEAMALITSDLTPKSVAEALKYGYWSVSFGVPFTNFQQTGVIQGTFYGKAICKMPALVFFSFYMMKLLNSKNIKIAKKSLREMLGWIIPKLPFLKRLIKL